ncbi:SulP family inorganic anion transporter [Paraburkholderia sabiae]|uniref:SulP family inorganic anion transporter n=1 Tax=Paraburkholderia sabiae TaxID=273251 RepID=A0ABU9QCI8_9BURK|nr:SulP family inorganic anion transporter [Paraburkholderia sabiae]WJZ75958.1 SulP family inorganic anion transporter [Paraburkholderia sabiae]CAD6527902.1 putative sulfate transporter [Paraburkholderia sabiae]
MGNDARAHAAPRQFRIPVLDWTHGYRKEWLKPDVVAGVTAAAVVLPKALAYASVAGLPVEVGLYTAFVPMVIYALFGTSRPLSVSTSATLAILTAAALAQAAPGGDTATLMRATAMLTLLVGGILALAALLRLGFVANFISDPVLTGFKAGIAVVIVLDQLPKLLGIHPEKGSFFHNVAAVAMGVPHASGWTVGVGVTTIVVLVALERLYPRAPAPLVAVACGIGAVVLLGLPERGVGVVGHIPTGLPSVVMPDLSLAGVLWKDAVGIALMSFTETIAAGRAFAVSGEPTPQPNRELFATGLGNAAGALLGSMPAGGGTSQTAVNRLAGARSQGAELVTATVTLGTMLLLAPLIGLMPHATLAAVVIVYSIGLFSPADFRAILRIRRTEFVWAIVALAGVVLLGTLQGILVAIVVSLVALAHQVADPPVYLLRRKPGTNVFRPVSAEHPDDESFPGLLVLRIEGRVFFANAGHIGEKLRPLIDDAQPQVVVLDMSAVFDIEYTALKMLIEAEKKQRERGVFIWLAHLNPGVLAAVQLSPLGATLGRERMYFNLEEALAAWQALRSRDTANRAPR